MSRRYRRCLLNIERLERELFPELFPPAVRSPWLNELNGAGLLWSGFAASFQEQIDAVFK